MVGVVEFLMSTYRLTIAEAVFGFSLPAAFALMPAAAVRQGKDLGPGDLIERARSKARRAKDREIRATHEIIPNPPKQ